MDLRQLANKYQTNTTSFLARFLEEDLTSKIGLYDDEAAQIRRVEAMITEEPDQRVVRQLLLLHCLLVYELNIKNELLVFELDGFQDGENLLQSCNEWWHLFLESIGDLGDRSGDVRKVAGCDEAISDP